MRTTNEAPSHVLDEAECQTMLGRDLHGVRGRILVVSPFATVQGILRWRTHLESAIQRGVSVCAIIQQPPNWERRQDGTLAADSLARLMLLQAAIELLQSIGVHVSLRPKMHEKIVVIDDDILWEGSINFLSWFNTSERARRWTSRLEVSAAIDKHKLLPCDHCAVLTIGMRLAQRRKAFKMTQDQLAICAGTHRKLVGQIESGMKNMQIDKLLRICDVLDLQLMLVPTHLASVAQHSIYSSGPEEC